MKRIGGGVFKIDGVEQFDRFFDLFAKQRAQAAKALKAGATAVPAAEAASSAKPATRAATALEAVCAEAGMVPLCEGMAAPGPEQEADISIKAVVTLYLKRTACGPRHGGMADKGPKQTGR